MTSNMISKNSWNLNVLICIVLGLSLQQGCEATRNPLIEPRILGGHLARPGQFPYQVSLLLQNTHNCGGTIISSKYVVTAAHCVVYDRPYKKIPVEFLSVRAGSVSSTSGGQHIAVEDTIPHPDYAPDFSHDIALVKLAKPLEFNAKVSPIEMASEDPKSGVLVSVSGWGRISYTGPMSPLLKHHTLVSLDNKDCRKWINGYVPESAICFVGSADNGICNGDSGGPAVYNNQLVGVVSFYQGKCGYNADGFASVAAHLEWLKTNSKE
uniref:Putative serine protease 53-like protein n=1 Tax=Haematobia irritans TaxID=7368 RepID=A0A1L8EJ55_HAEIR